MLTTFKRIPIFQTLMIALALTPAALFAFLGTFSRLKTDDYCNIAIGQERGAWGYMNYKLNTWSGAYADFFFMGLVAPLDTLLPRITPGIIVILWLFGLFWLVDEGLAHLKISHSRRPLAAALAALGAAAAINSLYSPQSLHFYSENIRYNLPLPLLTIYLALTLWLAKRTRLPAWGLVAGGLLCFITAGASEMFMVFQLTFLTGCLLMSLAWRRRSYARILGVGWLASLVGLMIQLNAPGIALRAAWIEADPHRPSPERSLLGWLSRTFEEILGALGHPPVFAGFFLLMAAGLLAMLFACRPPKTSKASKPVELVPSALWLGLIFQLLWLPILWSHVSDTPQFLSRFSPRYMVVIGLNLAFISSFAVLLWQRGRINAHLQRHERGLPIFCNALLLIFAALFALSQLDSSNLRADSWLFVTALMFLGLLCWQLSSTVAARRFGCLAVFVYALSLICLTAIVGATVFGRGFTQPRTLASSAYLLTFSGLVWGAYLGWLVKHLPSRYGQAWMKFGGLAIILIIGLGIVLGRAARIPDFHRHAQEWDARHLDIIAQRGRGQKAIEVAPLIYDSPGYITRGPENRLPISECAKRYYGFDSIALKDSRPTDG